MLEEAMHIAGEDTEEEPERCAHATEDQGRYVYCDILGQKVPECRSCGPDVCTEYAPPSEPDVSAQPETGMEAVMLRWHDSEKGGFEALFESLPELGFTCTALPRGPEGWAQEAADYVRENEPRLLVAFQRLYQGTTHEKVLKACQEVGTRIIIQDFALWPHYSAVWFDPEGDNAQSSVAGQFNHWLQVEPHRIERHMPQVNSLRAALLNLAHEAGQKASQLDLDHIPSGFTLVLLQRTGDEVLVRDAPDAIADPGRFTQALLQQAQAPPETDYMVIKPHPFDNEVSLPGSGPRKTVIQKNYGSQNDAVLAWLMVNASHIITVNSTTTYKAMALGKPITCCGDGWFSGNDVVKKAENPQHALQMPDLDPVRQRKFVAYMFSRQLTIEQATEPEKVKDMLTRFYPRILEQEKSRANDERADTEVVTWD